jgi:CRP/FNR family transcriptional regulator
MVEPAEPFGEVPVFEGGTYPAYAMTTVSSVIFTITREDFLELLKAYPEMAFHMMGFLCKRLRQFTRLVEDLSLKEVPGRLATYLLHLHSNKAGALTFPLDISKNQLAAILGTVPETLSRAFFRLKSLGMIDLDGATITIKDLKGLEEISLVGR